MEQVKRWFLENRRSFPWREGKDPYRVLVSEIMLQQTRASVVIAYFERWMERFPTVSALARAEESEVMKLWEGLGYYSRARNLLKMAKSVVEKFHGKVPDKLEDLLKLKGIGDYTAGAVLAFGFHQKAVALDGNVHRVMSRWLAYSGQNKKELQRQVFEVLPDKDAHIIMEGLIELGATVCKKKPLCSSCPLQQSCLGYQRGIHESLPILPERKQIIVLHRFVACIVHEGAYLVKQGEKGKVMEGLFEFPYVDVDEGQRGIEKLLGMKLHLEKVLKREKQHFTRYKAELMPVLFGVKERKEVAGYVWVKDLERLPFSSGHKRILTQLKSYCRAAGPSFQLIA